MASSNTVASADKTSTTTGIKCPQCGYVVSNPLTARCPRCLKVLTPMMSCGGSCAACGTKTSCGH